MFVRSEIRKWKKETALAVLGINKLHMPAIVSGAAITCPTTVLNGGTGPTAMVIFQLDLELLSFKK